MDRQPPFPLAIMILMANPVFDAVRSVMAIREYQEKPITSDVVTRIVDAGRLTASAANHQEWHFVVVREPETLRALGSLVRTGPYIAKSVLAIVVAYEKTSHTGISDCSRAIQSMLLTAWAEASAPTGPDSAALKEFGTRWPFRIATRCSLSCRSGTRLGRS